MERDSVGKLSSELLHRDTDAENSVGEQMQEQLSEYEQNVLECANRSKDTFTGDFYIVVITKREKLMQNVLRHYFFARESCPTPHNDQALYKYHKKDERTEFLWVIPDKEACKDLKLNAATIDPAFRQLLQFVLDYSDGTLDKKAASFNAEILV
jgi:hypothetical protein